MISTAMLGPIDVRSANFVRFDPGTGEIIEAGRMSRPAVLSRADYLALPDDALALDDLASFIAAHFVRDGAVVAKTPCPATLSGLTLSGLPQPCTVEISRPFFAPTRYPVTAADLILSFSQPGTYAVRVLSAPHLPGDFTVEAPGA